jgi:hypothetical protein
VRRELVVGSDECSQPLVIFRQRPELHAVGRLVDLDRASGRRGQTRRVDLEHVGSSPLDAPVLLEGVGVEAAQIGEAPRLHGRVR